MLPAWRFAVLAWNWDRGELRHGIFYATSVGNFMVDGLDVDDDSLDSSETTKREAGEAVGGCVDGLDFKTLFYFSSVQLYIVLSCRWWYWQDLSSLSRSSWG